MCMASENCKLQERVDAIDQRVTRLEDRMETGFQSVTAAVNQLAADFGQRMNVLDQRIVEEKAKWGAVLRRIVLWGAGTMLVLALAAAGINALPQIVKAFAAP